MESGTEYALLNEYVITQCKSLPTVWPQSSGHTVSSDVVGGVHTGTTLAHFHRPLQKGNLILQQLDDPRIQFILLEIGFKSAVRQRTRDTTFFLFLLSLNIVNVTRHSKVVWAIPCRLQGCGDKFCVWEAESRLAKSAASAIDWDQLQLNAHAGLFIRVLVSGLAHLPAIISKKIQENNLLESRKSCMVPKNTMLDRKL